MPSDPPPLRLSYSLGFLARTAFFSALACAVGLAILRWVFSRDLGSSYGAAFYTLQGLVGFLVPALVFCLIAVLMVASVSVFLVAVFASHKVAGPLFRLQRVAGHLAEGRLTGRVHLRATDQGKPVADALNDWVQARRNRFERLAAEADACERALEELAAEPDLRRRRDLLGELAARRQGRS